MSDQRYTIRRMEPGEVGFALSLAAAEGWNPGLQDADCFYAADPEGFFIGELDGEPISCISAVKYGDAYGFIGLYMVKPEYRGQGYGLRIWQAAVASLDGVIAGLGSVDAQIANYEKSGFEFAFFNARYGGLAPGGGAWDTGDDPGIESLWSIPFEDIAAYDCEVFGFSRERFLRPWVGYPDRNALALVDDGRLAGYTVIRKCIDGYKIGPLFADNPDVADSLFTAMLRRIPTGEPIYLDVPGEAQNPAATEMAQRYGMTEVFRTARMYRYVDTARLNLPLDRWFGITTFELG